MGFECVPHRTCIGRRLSGLAPEAERQIALLGRQIGEEVRPEDERPAVIAIDGRMYKAQDPKWQKGDRQKGLVPVDLRNVDTEPKWPKNSYRGWIQGYRLIVLGLAFPEPVPIFAAWRPNNENEANIAIEALLAGDLKETDLLLGDETLVGGLFPYLYKEAVGWAFSPKQLPKERRSWKGDLYTHRKETIELLFQRIIQALGLNECQVKGEGRNGASSWPVSGPTKIAISRITARARHWLVSNVIVTT